MAEDVIYTDGTFFDDMRLAERRILVELGATEALEAIDQEDIKNQRDFEKEMLVERKTLEAEGNIQGVKDIDDILAEDAKQRKRYEAEKRKIDENLKSPR